eukprot:364685-Chlamydomonas_euryale.AAC.12
MLHHCGGQKLWRLGCSHTRVGRRRDTWAGSERCNAMQVKCAYKKRRKQDLLCTYMHDCITKARRNMRGFMCAFFSIAHNALGAKVRATYQALGQCSIDR